MNKRDFKYVLIALAALLLVGSILACDAPVTATPTPASIPTPTSEATEVPVQPTVEPLENQGEGGPTCFLHLLKAGQSVCKTGNPEDYRRTMDAMLGAFWQCTEWCNTHSCATDQDVCDVLGLLVKPWLSPCPKDLAQQLGGSVHAVAWDSSGCMLAWEWPEDIRLQAVQVILDGQAYATVERPLLEGIGELNVCQYWLSSKPGDVVEVKFRVIVDRETVSEDIKVAEVSGSNFSYNEVTQ